MGSQIVSMGLLAATLILFIVIVYEFKSSLSAPSKGSVLVPDSNVSTKVDCSVKKTTCIPEDPTSCQNSCSGPEEMKCVKMNTEYVCLPKGPDVSCNKDHGGINVWTGYGFTDQKEWSCLCTVPQLYGGPSCDTVNPAYCGGGNLEVIQKNDPKCKIENGYQIYNNMCVKCNCPTDYGLVMRAEDNTPMCVSKTVQGGGGYMGLYGNYVKSPDWRNVYYNIDSKTNDPWSTLISKEFYYSDTPKIKAVLDKYISSNKLPDKLTQNIVNDLAGLSSNFKSNTPFDPNYKEDKVSYMYFDNVYIP